MNCYELQNRLVKCLFLSTELKKDQIKEKDTVMMSCGAEEFIFDKSFRAQKKCCLFWVNCEKLIPRKSCFALSEEVVLL